jgi:hypothetical protein
MPRAQSRAVTRRKGCWDGPNATEAYTASLPPDEAEFERLVLVRDLLTDAHGQLAQARAVDTRRIAGTYRLIERALTDALAAQLAEAEARAGRWKRAAMAEANLSTALVDLLTDDQANGPDYPMDLDIIAGETASDLHKHGDLTDTEEAKDE